MAKLGVNLDHVATLRQARYRDTPSIGEPDPVRAVHAAEIGGADVITMHLREDRRHVNDSDVRRARELTRVRFNLEMAATEDMIAFALEIRPHMCTLVPEGRMEVTTEGGLNVMGQSGALEPMVRRLSDAGIASSAFIDPDRAQIDAAAKTGFSTCELHTGPYARAFLDDGGDVTMPRTSRALRAMTDGANHTIERGMTLNAGHALNYTNVVHIASIPSMNELHIGHSIVARAIHSGLEDAVREMKRLIALGQSARRT